MTTRLTNYPRFKAWDFDGNFLAGGKLWTYSAGTASPKATYTDTAGLVPNENPVVLDGSGEATVLLGDGDYKFVLLDADDVEQWSVDSIASGPISAFSVSAEAGSEGFVRINTGLQLESSLQVTNGVVVMTSDAAYLSMKNTGHWAFLQAGDPSSGGPTWFADNTFTFPDMAQGGSVPQSGFLLAVSGAIAGAAAGNGLFLDSVFGNMLDSGIGMNQNISFPVPGRWVVWNNGSFSALLRSTPATANRIIELPDASGKVVVIVNPPASASAAGDPGSIAFDGSFAYFCVAVNTWLRVAIATW